MNKGIVLTTIDEVKGRLCALGDDDGAEKINAIWDYLLDNLR